MESLRESQIRASGVPESQLPPSPSSFDFEPWRCARVAEWSRPRYRLDEEQAFAFLTRRSSQENRKLRDLASELVADRAAHDGTHDGTHDGAGRDLDGLLD